MSSDNQTVKPLITIRIGEGVEFCGKKIGQNTSPDNDNIDFQTKEIAMEEFLERLS